jgi:hypothetical protein
MELLVGKYRSPKSVGYSCIGLTIFMAIVFILMSVYVGMTAMSGWENSWRVIIFGVGCFLLMGVAVWASHVYLYWEARKNVKSRQRVVNFDRELRHRSRNAQEYTTRDRRK